MSSAEWSQLSAQHESDLLVPQAIRDGQEITLLAWCCRLPGGIFLDVEQSGVGSVANVIAVPVDQDLRDVVDDRCESEVEEHRERRLFEWC